jgi:hypothetical protein
VNVSGVKRERTRVLQVHTRDVPSDMHGVRRRMSRVSLRSPWFFAVLGVGSELVGMVIAALLGAPLGEEHGCPAAASVANCHYPPDTQAWPLSRGLGGLLVGLALATFVAVTMGTNAPRRRPQKHLLVQAAPPLVGRRGDPSLRQSSQCGPPGSGGSGFNLSIGAPVSRHDRTQRRCTLCGIADGV